MKKLIPVFAITAILLSQAIVSSYGKENNGQNVKEDKVEIKQSNGKLEIKSENKVESEATEIESDENKNRIKFLEKKDDEFKIWGPIQSFTSSSITIDGKTINYDINIKVVGIIAVGKYAKVEGENTEDGLTAEKIVVDNRNKATSTPSISPTTTLAVSISPTITATVTPTVSITPETTGTPTVTTSETPSITPTATETPLLEGSSNNVFILDQLILKLERFIGSLLGLSN